MSVLTASSGSNAVTSGWDGAPTLSSTLSNVGGVLTLNGQRPVHIVGLAGAVAGHGSSATVSMSYAGVSTSNFTAAAGSAAVGTGYKSISIYLTGAASSTFRYTSSSAIYFGRSSTTGSNGVSDGVGAGFTGTLGMSYEYYTAPTAPLSPTVMRATSTSATLGWSAPSSDGGPGLTGYNVQASPVADFSSGVVSTTASAGATSATVTGLSTNLAYFFRIAARNDVSDHYSTSSVWSAVVQMPEVIVFPKVWNGTAWVRPVQWLVWTGTQWQQPSAILAYDGTNWNPAV